MPEGPKGQRRPADVIGNAGEFPTGEEAEEFDPDDGKDQAARSLGRGGGKARRQGVSSPRHTAEKARTGHQDSGKGVPGPAPVSRPGAGSSLPRPVAHIRNPAAILYLCHMNRGTAAHSGTSEDLHSPKRSERSILVPVTRLDQHSSCAPLLQRCRPHVFRVSVKIIGPTKPK